MSPGFGLAALAAAACGAGGLSLALGAYPIGFGAMLSALAAYDPDTVEHLILRHERLPRTIAGLVVGAALGTSGAILQSVARNPLAEPGLLGTNAGAALAVVILAAVWPGAAPPLGAVAMAALTGAIAATAVVFALVGLGSGQAATPLRLTLAGAVLAMLLGAATAGLLLVGGGAFDTLRLWMAGSLGGRPAATAAFAPLIIAGLLGAVAIGRSIMALSLGSAVAAGLGVATGPTALAAAGIAAALAGLAVAVAGPIGFIGLIAPHLARLLAGARAETLIPASALAGATLLTAADVAARIVVAPAEVPVGVVAALLGAPAFLWLLGRAAARPSGASR